MIKHGTKIAVAHAVPDDDQCGFGQRIVCNGLMERTDSAADDPLGRPAYVGLNNKPYDPTDPAKNSTYSNL